MPTPLVPPSAEARRLLQVAPWLARSDSRAGQVAREVLIAPFTQLTLVSFDLQAYLFDLLHTSTIARVGHGVGMLGVVAIGLCGAAGVHPGLAVAAAAALWAWYAVIARAAGLPGWAAAMALGMAGLAALAVACPLGATAAIGGVAASAFVVAVSHLAEPTIPPRAGEGDRWVSVPEYAFGRPDAPVRGLERLRRIGRLIVLFPLGFANELWASPRLLPYNVLWLMMDVGYAPALRATLDARIAAATADGNPALDFVGSGGATCLAV